MSDENHDKELRVEKFIFDRPEAELEKIKGNPQKVLQLVEEYSRKENLMIIGPHKGQIVIDKIKERPRNILAELGCYIGYSAVLFAKELPDDGSKYYSFEVNPTFAKIAQRIIELAGLEKKVEIIVGKAGQTLIDFQAWLQKGHFRAIDFILIDHWKDLYVPDLRLLESLSLIAPGTTIAADNIYIPGAPEYKWYVEATPEERREYNSTHENVNGKSFTGRWNILYDSKAVTSTLGNGMRDDVEITETLQYLDA
ncbi:Piso0_000468 [Millerozyma farinosa CBS 7064]|uniref:catechol O-methyltransferase n=1 Tax=Pichia sorbitophila (strain ATCC MYA-4447 / BCRC 22081 / CBS 7064 / NBRC 10061 / NRRL Y-12695) TaxID=559304 RepID=G8YU27_PICSO|nr:Piso0_000468 [Millerozyma farinosa CBS 7064]CCE73428.1 Piso0_000468 [Millerozyma farinosa CBS 7064]